MDKPNQCEKLVHQETTDYYFDQDTEGIFGTLSDLFFF